MKEELARRKSNVEKLREFFLQHQGIWIDAVELEPLGGRQAWRTRVSDLRKALEKEGLGTIENRIQTRNTLERANDGQPVRLWLGGAVLSQYRYLPFVKLGRSAETRMESPQRSLFNV